MACQVHGTGNYAHAKTGQLVDMCEPTTLFSGWSCSL